MRQLPETRVLGTNPDGFRIDDTRYIKYLVELGVLGQHVARKKTDRVRKPAKESQFSVIGKKY